MGSPLVIGIGNPLRGDDGVGALLAMQAAGQAQVRRVHQLTPELAVELAQRQAVLFIDAWATQQPAAPQLIALVPQPPARWSHHCRPEQLLGLSQALYGRAPSAHLLRVPAGAFAHGTALSRTARQAMPQAQRLMAHWLLRCTS